MTKLTERQAYVLKSLRDWEHPLYDFIPMFTFRGKEMVFRSLKERGYIYRLDTGLCNITYEGRKALEAHT